MYATTHAATAFAVTRTFRSAPIIVLILASISLAPSLIAQSELVRGTLGQRLDSLFREAEGHGFHGNALFAQHGDVVLLKGYGYANHSTNTRFGPSTLVQIGSNVKDFTKVAIFLLIEQDRLRLTDSLDRFIDSLAPDKRGITVEHLLEHASGLPIGFGSDAYPLTRSEMLQRLNSLKLAFTPGTRQQYSNLGYSLLALIIERLSGQAYDAYIAKKILEPVGMRKTGTYLPQFDRTQIAHGYQGSRDNGVILDMPHDGDGHLWNLRGNGGYLSTLSDMRRFYRALLDSTLLRKAAHRRGVFAPEHSAVLAGSDMVCFFMFANFPVVNAEAFVASNHSTFKANRLIGDIESILGVSTGPRQRRIATEEGPGRPGGDRRTTTGGKPAFVTPMLDRLPDNGIGRTIGAYIEAFNTGDTAVMRRFFIERTLTGPDSPPIEVRLERYNEMHSNLGRLTFRGIRQSLEGAGWAVSMTTESGDPATLTFMVEEDPPNRLRGIRVLVGN